MRDNLWWIHKDAVLPDIPLDQIVTLGHENRAILARKRIYDYNWCVLADHVEQWCSENFQRVTIRPGLEHCDLRFQSAADAALFKLFWC